MNPRKPKHSSFLVAIVGGSGSGKSWLASRLERALNPNAARLSLDDFYRDRSHLPPARRARINFDQPGAIDWDAVETAVQALARGRAARVPLYDFKTHSRLNGFKVVPAKRVVLMDGLWLLRRPSLRRLFGLGIFIECPTPTRLRRRLQRDRGSRGRTRASVLAQFWGTVEPMHDRYVAPQARYAEAVIRRPCRAQDVNRLVTRIRRGIAPN